MQIFLSYASEDREQAEEIQLALLSSGHHVFFDKTSLPAGGDYRSRIQRAVQNSDIFVFLISPNSVAQGNYALTELKYARAKWPHPKDKLLPVLLGATEWNAIPPYLKSVVVLEPEGNIAAEVVAAIVSLSRGQGSSSGSIFFTMKIGLAIIGLAGVLWFASDGPEQNPPPPPPPPPEALDLDSLQALRKAATRFGSTEHIIDGETVPITAYPSLVDVTLLPAGRPPTGPSIALGPGMSLDLRFRDAVVGFGIYYKQGLDPSNFNIYFHGGAQKVLTGEGYIPETGFIAEVSENPIERVFIQPQAHGSLTITGIYIFAKGQHERVLQ